MASSGLDSIQSIEVNNEAVAELSTISLARLRSSNSSELKVLTDAASKTGFFYLDLRQDIKGELMLGHVPDIYAVAQKYFAQPEKTKMDDVRLDIKSSQDLGWKRGKGGQSFEMSRDEINARVLAKPFLPQCFQDEWQKITAFNAGCDEACTTLLACLSATSIEHHKADQPSDTGLKLVSYPSMAKTPHIGDSLHTDSGSLTLLFFEELSICAFPPNSSQGAFIPPLEGCALVNVGDALQRLSGGQCHSPQHGVTQPCDGVKERYFLSYFLRPESVLIDRWNAGKSEPAHV